ncbi:hypothetical protein GCM10010151_54020 [Actinoallomurus spadix]|uniref:Uncharacterized protein n=1 Tax=Actinoallomurus spadix TaxID=79912 RepID=A0ABP3H0H3_9ACTN
MGMVSALVPPPVVNLVAVTVAVQPATPGRLSVTVTVPIDALSVLPRAALPRFAESSTVIVSVFASAAATGRRAGRACPAAHGAPAASGTPRRPGVRCSRLFTVVRNAASRGTSSGRAASGPSRPVGSAEGSGESESGGSGESEDGGIDREGLSASVVRGPEAGRRLTGLGSAAPLGAGDDHAGPTRAARSADPGGQEAGDGDG